MTSSDDPKAILGSIDRKLRVIEKGRDQSYSILNLPDLVGIAGDAAARPLVKRAVLSSASYLMMEGELTVSLAAKIALESIQDMKVARWDLADSMEGFELYEAMERKFAKTDREKPADAADALAALERLDSDAPQQRYVAKTYYIMSLIARGMIPQAATAARADAGGSDPFTFNETAVQALERSGHSKSLDSFFYELLSQNPELPYWDTYFRIAANVGTTDRMLALARSAAAKALPAVKTSFIREHLYRALLAADLVEEAVSELRSVIASNQDAKPIAPRRNRWSTAETVEAEDHPFVLIKLGRLLKQPTWIAEGIDAVTRLVASTREERSPTSSSESLRLRLASVLVEEGRLGEAERLVQVELIDGAKPREGQREAWSYRTKPRGQLTALQLLTVVYQKADRLSDVLLLLDQASGWGTADLATLSESKGDGLLNRSHGDKSNGNGLWTTTAAALLQTGRKEEALKVVRATLDAFPGDDRAYDLLVRIQGQSALTELDVLASRDPFEERPLIWKSFLLFQAGKLEEAETTARRAVAVDPSDGEQGKGDRMRVYAVLADIRAARGDQKEAEFFRGVVRAIRLSEDADDFVAAGLQTRAVKMYRESLTHFQDAYCIQSRLAVQLSELGRHEEAAQHYEKAFELMPDSFGRVESHCFGCESTFAAKTAQTLAERVFEKLATKNPKKPQVHYLLGYLRQEQHRGRAALPHFRQAVLLDPDYLNAWEHLQELSETHRLPTKERDDITLNILRLDPSGRHASASLTQVVDLRRLWAGLEASEKGRIPFPTSVMPLPASRVALQAGKKPRPSSLMPDDFRDFSDEPSIWRGRHEGVHVRDLFARHQLLGAIVGLLQKSEE